MKRYLVLLAILGALLFQRPIVGWLMHFGIFPRPWPNIALAHGLGHLEYDIDGWPAKVVINVPAVKTDWTVRVTLYATGTPQQRRLLKDITGPPGYWRDLSEVNTRGEYNFWHTANTSELPHSVVFGIKWNRPEGSERWLNWPIAYPY